MKCYSCIYLTGGELDGNEVKICSHSYVHSIVNPDDIERCSVYRNEDPEDDDLEE